MIGDVDRAVVNAGRDAEQNYAVLCAARAEAVPYQQASSKSAIHSVALAQIVSACAAVRCLLPTLA